MQFICERAGFDRGRYAMNARAEARLDYGIQLIKSETPSGVVRVSPRLVGPFFSPRRACRDRLRLKADRLERADLIHCSSETRETLREFLSIRANGHV